MQALLQYRPEARPSAAAALRHPFLSVVPVGDKSMKPAAPIEADSLKRAALVGGKNKKPAAPARQSKTPSTASTQKAPASPKKKREPLRMLAGGNGSLAAKLLAK